MQLEGSNRLVSRVRVVVWFLPTDRVKVTVRVRVRATVTVTVLVLFTKRT